MAFEDPYDNAGKKSPKPGKTPYLDQFGEDLTAMAKQGKLDPIIGRDAEILRICQVLARRKKNNPIILGDPGVGKTAIVEAIAQRIVNARSEKPIKTSFELKEVLNAFVPKAKEHKVLAQIFQGIRIEVNQEIEVLKEFLLQVPEILNEGGRLSVISYHSLEDRLVKRFINSGMFSGELEKDIFGNTNEPLKKVGKLIVPSNAEIKQNNRARSAKLRIATLKK